MFAPASPDLLTVRRNAANTSHWASFVLVGVAWFVVRYLQTKHLGWGTGFDVGLYEQYARSWGGGVAPYAQFHPEYPPGSLLVFLLPYLVGGNTDYAHNFALAMACFDLVGCLLVFRTMQAGARRRVLPFAAAALYTLGTGALYPVLYTRFDVVPAVIMLAAYDATYRRKEGLGAFWLGVAGGVKLWPFAAGPLWVAYAYHRGGLRMALRVCLFVGLGALAVSFLVLPRAGWSVFEFLKYHGARGIQIETTWSTIALALNALHLAEAHPEHNFGAFHLAGTVATKFATWSMPAMVMAALLPALTFTLGKRRRVQADRAWTAAVVATVLGFMVFGKVLSPQYMLWVAPLLPLVACRPFPAIVVLTACVLTSWVYPHLSPALEMRAPGHMKAVLVVGGRNLLLLGFYVHLVLAAAWWGRKRARRR